MLTYKISRAQTPKSAICRFCAFVRSPPTSDDNSLQVRLNLHVPFPPLDVISLSLPPSPPRPSQLKLTPHPQDDPAAHRRRWQHGLQRSLPTLLSTACQGLTPRDNSLRFVSQRREHNYRGRKLDTGAQCI